MSPVNYHRTVKILLVKSTDSTDFALILQSFHISDATPSLKVTFLWSFSQDILSNFLRFRLFNNHLEMKSQFHSYMILDWRPPIAVACGDDVFKRFR